MHVLQGCYGKLGLAVKSVSMGTFSLYGCFAYDVHWSLARMRHVTLTRYISYSVEKHIEFLPLIATNIACVIRTISCAFFIY